MGFMTDMKETMLNSELNMVATENGALGYKSTGKELVDFNFSVSSLRNIEEEEIKQRFAKVFYENKLLAIKYLFFVSDVRAGMGERRLFRICIEWLANTHPNIVIPLLAMIPQYNRWDNMFHLLQCNNKEITDAILTLIKNQLDNDINQMGEGRPISLLAKWMPSINTSSEETKKKAKIIAKGLKMSDKSYRLTLSRLRKYLKVVEVNMSANEWDLIDYAAVPSKANLLYKDAFMKHDEDRRSSYLEALKKGETKINGAVNFPHDIVNKYWQYNKEDTTYEELWKALPDYVNGNNKTMVVRDGSGSMRVSVGSGTLTANIVATALAVYFSEKCTGEFKDKHITFSRTPRYIDTSQCNTLLEKLDVCYRYSEISNTNIEAVFDLILRTAQEHNMSQEDMPSTILILSDMEFDSCAESNSTMLKNEGVQKVLFKTISERYASAGYKLPKLAFWNIASRTGAIPLKENESGVALLSGFSPAVVRMVLSSKLDPYEVLLEQLNDNRYDPVEAAIKNII